MYFYTSCHKGEQSQKVPCNVADGETMEFDVVEGEKGGGNRLQAPMEVEYRTVHMQQNVTLIDTMHVCRGPPPNYQ